MKKTALKRKTPLRPKMPKNWGKLRSAVSTAPRHKKPLKSTTATRRRTKKRNKDGTLPKSEKVRILKKKLWVAFSRYIRRKYADKTGWLVTVDGVRAHWKEVDCGHLRHNSERNALLGGNELWYYENNFAPQSNQGNRLNADDSTQKYMLWAIKKYGIKEVDKMFRLRETYKLWTYEELVDKYEYYTSEFDKLEK